LKESQLPPLMYGNVLPYKLRFYPSSDRGDFCSRGTNVDVVSMLESRKGLIRCENQLVISLI
jgi:hypothetical protein